MTKFTLVNPKIDGSVQTSFDTSSPLKAADEAYSAISKYFTNRLQEFRFTLQSGGKFHHFVASEKLGKDNKVSYTINEFKGKVNIDTMQKSMDQYQEQNGGKKKWDEDDSSSSSSDSSPAFRRYNYPIYNWWYDPFVYVVTDKDASDKLKAIWFPSLPFIPGNYMIPNPYLWYYPTWSV
uniref:Uncharacterized protein n=1 Tax=viral metagenome TaxID=1070528 RepID=A0A6C0M1E4_9ZZZZ